MPMFFVLRKCFVNNSSFLSKALPYDDKDPSAAPFHAASAVASGGGGSDRKSVV